jgi:hypothetical protein
MAASGPADDGVQSVRNLKSFWANMIKN